MKAHYVIDYNGLRTSPTIDIPEGLNIEQALTYTYGQMMLEYWTLDTPPPHAIFIDDGSGYKRRAGDKAVAKYLTDKP